ncbi:MAG TPA: DUF881 domain-containing protein [Nocardioidaceae bacterium]|nr:DUF881 domain-containing protein [Nocardioidaceae bacterium]
MQGPPIAEYDHPPGADSGRADSMSLLNHLMRNTLDEDYAYVAEQRGAASEPPRRKGYVGLVVATVVFGLMLAVAAIQTDRSRPALEEERAGLIERIHEQSDDFDQLRAQSAELTLDVRALQADVDELTERGARVSGRAEQLGVVTGTFPAVGPGMVVTVDDAAESAGHQGQVLDSDLRTLVNGLWVAGAEAISINGQRITSRTAIGSANRAITVNFRSLQPPYVVRAIGDPNTLEARFFETAAGQTWLDLEANFGLQFDTETVDSLTVPARNAGQLRYADDTPQVTQ